MKIDFHWLKIFSIFLALLFTTNLLSQSSGIINRQATSAGGRLILDPNSDGYTSASTSGFGSNDVANSEIPYNIVKSYSIEPFGDLRRGPDHRFSDFVPDGSYNGFYTFFTGTNWLFRFRLGSIMSGSKGYSILLDTDGKFGSSGINADPNYVAATTGTNGNPGFEIEIVLETNFRIAIYNVDGSSSPTLIQSYSNWQDMSQVSIAASYDNGDPDFFMDFYIPFSVLQAAPFNLTSSSPIRMVPTTVMSPQGAIGGPKSDIYGLNDDAYSNSNDQYEVFINTQPTFTLNNLTNAGGGIPSMCTAPPIVNSPVSTGTVNITGTWTRSTLDGSVALANITVYKNSAQVGVVNNISSGNVWTLNSISVSNGDIITAKAQATGESMCLLSNAVVASNCNSSNMPAQPTGFCADRKGFEAANYPAGATINIYKMTSSSQTLFYSALRGGTSLGVTTVANGAGWMITSGCSGGNGNFDGGSYMVYYSLGGCDSKVSFACAVNTIGGWNSQPSPAPVINNSSSIFNSTTNISGTAVAGSLLRLYIDDVFIASPTLTGTNWSYTFSTPLTTGQVIGLRTQLPNDNSNKIYYCTGLTTATVSCFSKPPLVNVDANNQVTAGLPISGTSTEQPGSIVRVYTSTPVLVATTTVQANGTWSTGNAGTTPSVYNSVNATSYYASVTVAGCTESIVSGTVTALAPTSVGRCGTITGPVETGAASVSGTITGLVSNTTINLYLDDILIGTTTTNSSSWGPITVNTTINNTLYANGVLSISVQESGKQEVFCPSSATTISCSPFPNAPNISPTSSTITVNQNLIYTISNAVAGTFYGIADGVSGQSYATGIWATSNGSLDITTNVFSNTGSYNILVKATSINGLTVCTSLPASAALSVTTTLPVTLLSFTGKWKGEVVELKWETESETNGRYFELEKSMDGISFLSLAIIEISGNSSVKKSYSFVDTYPGNAVNYYRLKMVDLDGKFSYSKIVFLQKNNLGIVINSIRPNPVVDELTVSILLDKQQQLTASLFNISGQVLHSIEIKGQQGLNNIRFGDLNKISKGLYILQLHTTEQFLNFKIIKL